MGLGKLYVCIKKSEDINLLINLKFFLLGKKRCWIIKKLNECGLICNYLKVFN